MGAWLVVREAWNGWRLRGNLPFPGVAICPICSKSACPARGPPTAARGAGGENPGKPPLSQNRHKADIAPARGLHYTTRPDSSGHRTTMNKNKKSPTKAAAPAKVSNPKAQTTPKTARQSRTRPAAPASPVVRLQLAVAGARSVAVAGSFNSWQPEPATQTGDGAWVKELAVKPGRYEYLFVVDGQWCPDPNAREQVPNPFGGQNSVLVIGQ